MQQRRVVIDQMGREVKFNYPPQRIVSLVPSQTELLYDLDLDEKVVGITKFCEHPESWLKTKATVGGTKKLRLDVIASLHPDLIIGNKEENDRSSIDALEKYPVWMSDIVTLKDALWMIAAIGELTGKMNESRTINNKIVSNFKLVERKEVRVLYLIWRNPWMGAGVETFIHAMLMQMGLVNVLDTVPRYPELTLGQIKSFNTDHIFLSSEPYPFQEKHRIELASHLPNTKISLVDGQLFSWYGSRLIQAPEYFNTLLTSL